MNWEVILVAVIAAAGPMILQAATWRRQDKKLREIHTLVNSNLTASILESFSSSTRELAALMELRDKGLATQATLDAIIAARLKIAELTIALHDRNKQT